MVYTHRWATPTRTSAFVAYPNSYVYSQNISFPDGLPDINGNHPVAIFGIAAGYAAGASGIQPRISYRGRITTGSTIFTESGGTFEFQIFYTGGTLQFGREFAKPNIVRNTGDSGTWEGELAGQFDWSTVSSAPEGISVQVQNGNDLVVTIGNATIDGGNDRATMPYFMEVNREGTGWFGTRQITPGQPAFFTDLPPGNYVVRAYTSSAAGISTPGLSGWINIAAPLPRIRRATSQAGDFAQVANIQRFTGTSWSPVSIKRRFDGANWIDLG